MKKLALILFCFILLGTTTGTSAENLASLATSVQRGALSKESIYFVMTDRFENGDKTNDTAGLSTFRLTSGWDSSDPAWWHGGDFSGLESRLSYIQSMGFSAIWITPPVKQKFVQGSSGAYHGYWGLDFTTVDPHLGTELEFKSLISAAHKIGIKVIIDVVANHTADVITYSADSDKLVPRVSMYENNIKKPAFLNKLSNYHNLGEIPRTKDETIYGDFFGLDDIASENPEVIKGFTSIWTSWIEKYDIDGLRIDTFKHVNPIFWKSVIPKVQGFARSVGKKEFPIFGEVSDPDAYTLASYVQDRQVPSVLDFNFQKTVSTYAGYGSNSAEMAKLFNADDAYTTATTSAYGLVTFLGNHDMGRVGKFLLRDTGFDLEKTLNRSKLANGLLFLLRGSPTVYYGDESGMTGAAGDKLARQDMFPTDVEIWKSELRIGSQPVGIESSFDVSNPLREQIKELQELISKNPVLRNGTQQTRFANKGVFAVSRYGMGQEYIVAFNSSDSSETFTVNPGNAETEWSVIAGSGSVTGLDDSISLTIPPCDFLVLKAVTPLIPKVTPKVVLLAAKDGDYTPNWIELSAKVPGNDYVQVTFATRQQGKSWKVVGTSDHRTFAIEKQLGGLFRVYIRPQDYKNSKKIDVVAIVRNSKQETSVSKIQTIQIN